MPLFLGKKWNKIEIFTYLRRKNSFSRQNVTKEQYKTKLSVPLF